MKKHHYILLLIILLTLLHNTNAQVCIDSLRITPGYVCPDPTFKPVCGCDGKTYRNDCEAKYRYGVNTWNADGPCSGFEFDILPTYVSPYMQGLEAIKFKLIQNSETPATLVIIDSYGKSMYYRTLPGLKEIDIYINEFINWQIGVYIVLVYNGKGTYRYKKFVKVGY